MNRRIGSTRRRNAQVEAKAIAVPKAEPWVVEWAFRLGAVAVIWAASVAAIQLLMN